MKPARVITIICHDGNDFAVHEGERYVDRLCWDEMLGQVATMTHPDIAGPRYGMRSPEENLERLDRLKRSAADHAA